MKSCPHCWLQLDNGEWEGMSISVCPGCGGRWFPLPFSNDLQEKTREELRSIDQHYIGHAQIHLYEGLPSSCPDCKTSYMESFSFAAEDDHKYLKCAKCGGIWMESLPYSADKSAQPASYSQPAVSAGDESLQGTMKQPQEQEELTPQPVTEQKQNGSAVLFGETILQSLLDGNIRFSNGKSLHPHCDRNRLINIADAPSPVALVISCSDARVPPEIVLDQGLGDIFVIRTAGMALSSLDLATIRYAVNRWQIPLILVLGHTKCAAVEEALSRKQQTNPLEPVLDIIRPGLKSAALQPGNAQDNAVLANIQRTIVQLILAFPHWQERLTNKENLIAAALYHVDDGTVQLVKLSSSPIKTAQNISADQGKPVPEHQQASIPAQSQVMPVSEIPAPQKSAEPVPPAHQKWCPRCLQGYMPNIRFCSLCGIPLVGPDARIQCPFCRQVNVISADNCWSCMKPLHNNIDPRTGKMKPSDPNQMQVKPVTSCSSTSVFIFILIMIVMMLILHHT